MNPKRRWKLKEKRKAEAETQVKAEPDHEHEHEHEHDGAGSAEREHDRETEAETQAEAEEVRPEEARATTRSRTAASKYMPKPTKARRIKDETSDEELEPLNVFKRTDKLSKKRRSHIRELLESAPKPKPHVLLLISRQVDGHMELPMWAWKDLLPSAS